MTDRSYDYTRRCFRYAHSLTLASSLQLGTPQSTASISVRQPVFAVARRDEMKTSYYLAYLTGVVGEGIGISFVRIQAWRRDSGE